MSINREIKQQRFFSSKQKALVNLLYTYGFVLERIKKILSGYDLTHQQFNILRILRGSYPKPLSTLQIRERMLDKMSDTSRMVDRLIVKGLTHKTVSVGDRRLVDVIISEKGQALLRQIDEAANIVETVMEKVTEEEMNYLSYLLDKIRDGMEDRALDYSINYKRQLK